MKITANTKKLYQSFIERDSNVEGDFFVGVKTTGIFCRPTCRARKPKFENIEFFTSTKDCLLQGYRPCKVCQPMKPIGQLPEWVDTILKQVMKNPSQRLKDWDIQQAGINPNRLRRWFNDNHNMTFQAYLRSLRLSQAIGCLNHGEKVITTALEHGYNSLSGFTAAFKHHVGTTPSQSTDKEIIYVTRFNTPVGSMIAAAVTNGICMLEFSDRKMLETQFKKIQQLFHAPIMFGDSPHFNTLIKQLEEYFDGQRKEFSVPLITSGSEFQNKVWQQLTTIPYGKTRSYLQQATAIDNPKAVRAVANANGANRISIIIPCHRVIGSNGKLTGYGGGLWRKQLLLDLEKKYIDS